MKIHALFISLFLLPILMFGQYSGPELLDKAIAYHDPNGAWPTFDGSMSVTMNSPKSSPRTTQIKINLPNEYFYAQATSDSIITTYQLEKDNCIISKIDSLRITQLKEVPSRSHCEMTSLYKNYYSYLYGLPMKLKDPGTNVSEKVERKSFQGKEYLVLEVTYDEAVGSDVWYFYFNPDTFAMEIYQFFKGDPSEEGKDTGEYILLSEETLINGIKMPKNRAWYYNKNNEYLGTDILNAR